VEQNKLEKSSTTIIEPTEDLNKEKQDIMSELNALANESSTKSTFLSYIPKDLKAECRIYLDVIQAPVI